MNKFSILVALLSLFFSYHTQACGYGNIERSVSCTVSQAIINDGSGLANTVVNVSARYANRQVFKTESALSGILSSTPDRDGSTNVTLQIANTDNNSLVVDTGFKVRFRDVCDGSDIVYENTVVTPIYYAVVEVHVVCSAEIRFDRD